MESLAYCVAACPNIHELTIELPGFFGNTPFFGGLPPPRLANYHPLHAVQSLVVEPMSGRPRCLLNRDKVCFILCIIFLGKAHAMATGFVYVVVQLLYGLKTALAV